MFHVGKVGHCEDGIDKHDQEQEEANIEQGRKWHHQGKQECTNAFGSFDKTKNAADSGKSDDSE